ncbi:MAG: glycoside hydrolase family 3 C-terminal domain-containing protein [Ignavibacteriales bacterium]|nr:glycoside hydrolase family 3 C-terminal domain-containing protein [Ignavibacteriales bacterium]
MISKFNFFRFVRSGALCVSLLLFVSGCGDTGTDESIPQVNPAGDDYFSGITDTTSADVVFSDAPDHFVDSLLKTMTLEEKIGQMLFPAVQPGRQTLDELDSKHFKKYKPGGFVLFGSSLIKTANMIRELQDESEIPLLISEDFERGLAMRIPGAKSYPFNMAIGAADAPLLVYEMGKRIAADSKIIGVHWNLAPVLDINNNSENPIINVRSFGEDPEQVANLGIMMMKGLQAGGVLSSLKHFPGHGNSSVDSHTDLAVIKGSKEEFERNELFPFKKNIDKDAFSVMVGHLGIEAYNLQDTPATLSHRIVTGLLRDELKFKGIINTDAMSMKAISKYHSPGEAAVLAVNAGVDVIMTPLSTIESLNAILKEVSSGRISEARINQSVRRILQAKKWLGLFRQRYAPMSEVEKLMKEEPLDEIGRDLAIRSITLVKNDPLIFPLDKKSKYLHIVIKDGKDFPNEKVFIEEIEKRNKNIETWQLPQNPDKTDLTTFKEKTENFKTIIVSIYLQIRNSTGRINLDQNKVELVNSLVRNGKKVILLAHSHPYALKHFPDVAVFITNYGAEFASEMAMAASVFGEHNISGKLPVTIKGTNFKKGDGIDLLKEKGKLQALIKNSR